MRYQYLHSPEVIPALLTHLSIPHVSVACHSAGTIWALDLLVHHPELLHPSRPYLAIGAPWILPSHTGQSIFSFLQLLPRSVISGADKLARLVYNIDPILNASSGVSMAMVAKLTPTPVVGQDGGGNRVPEGAKFEEDLWPSIMERIYAEGVQGVGSEALLVLQKVGAADGMAGSGWSDWGGYDKLVPRLADALRAAGRRLRVDVFYAEKDALVGDGGGKGSLWFDRCWGENSRGEVIDYQSKVVEGADHDRIWNLRWGAVQELFGKVGSVVDEAPLVE
jgi:pimeloyl-ACP methyl ester carboxylesterase